jgi:hypothetical protein
VEIDVRSLFGLPGNIRTQGWLKVQGSGRLAGYLTYATNQALAAVVSQAEPRTQLTFSQVAEDGTGYFTGLAVLNANTEAVTVNISVFDADGVLVAATDSPYSVPSNGRIIDVLNRLVKSDQVKNQRGGYIVVSASLPVFGIEIFGTSDSRAFANVPADLDSGHAWIDGFRQIHKKMHGLLEEEGVVAVPRDGEFDPALHEAVTSEPSENVPSGNIIATLRTGYTYRGRVLRPALVRVAL